MKLNTRFILLILLIAINLNLILTFTVVFYGTSETTFERLTGKPTGQVEMCLDQWINLSQLPDQEAYEGSPYSVDVNVTNEDSYVILNFSDNTSIFNITSTTGVISFTPPSGQYGNYTINITVSNLACNTYDDSMIFNLTIHQTNFAPILNLSSNFTNLVQGVLFYFNVSNNVTDPENDPILFYDNTSLFNIGLHTGIIAFVPTNAQVGNHSVKITVSDGYLVDDQDVVFSIANVNDPPVLDPIGAQTAYVNYTFKLNLSAYDVDLNENLTFFSNTSWFLNITGPNATINTYVKYNLTLNFTNFSEWNGTYSINVTVNDSNGVQDSEVISFTITYLNRPPNITSYYPISKTKGLYKGYAQYFNITKFDPDGTLPSTQWFVDDVLVGTNDNYTLSGITNISQVLNVTARITDGVYDDAESWLITILPSPPPPVLGTSVGSGGFGGDVIRVRCEELWTCTDWTICAISGLQSRECEDLYKCGTIKHKPNETRICTYVEFPSCFDGVQNQNEVLIDCGGVCAPCPTCDDGIQNHGETAVDCGGPCPACKEVREPTKPIKLKFSAQDIVSNINIYWFVWFLITLFILSTIRLWMFLRHEHPMALLDKALIPIKIIRIKLLMAKTQRLINNHKKEKAKKLYNKAKSIWNKLPIKAKRKIKF